MTMFVSATTRTVGSLFCSIGADLSRNVCFGQLALVGHCQTIHDVKQAIGLTTLDLVTDDLFKSIRRQQPARLGLVCKIIRQYKRDFTQTHTAPLLCNSGSASSRRAGSFRYSTT